MLLPFREPSIQHEEVLFGNTVIIEVEEEPGGKLIATFVVHHDLFRRTDSPGLKELFYLCVRYSPETIREQVIDIYANRAGNVLFCVGLR